MKRLGFLRAVLRALAAILALSVVLPGVAAASNPLALGTGSAYLPLEGHIEILRDPEGRLTLEDVAGGGAAGFEPIPGAVSLGFTADTLWVRFALRRAAGAPAEWYLQIDPPFLDDIAVHVSDPAAAGTYRAVVLGDTHPVAGRPVRYRSFLVPLELPEERTVTVYARVRTTSSLILRAGLHTAPGLIAEASEIGLLLGAFIGIAAIVVLMNSVYWLWLRDSVYFYYMLYVVTLVAVYLPINGTLTHFWPDGAHRLSNLLTGTSAALGIALVCEFTVRLLRLKAEMPLAYRIVRVGSWVGYGGAVVSALGHFQKVATLINTTMLLVIAVVTVASAVLVRRGSRPARLYLLAFVASIVGVYLQGLRTLGMLPSNAVTDNALQVASLFHMVLMNVALASRIKMAEDERAAAQRQALAATQDAERRATAVAAERTQQLAHAKEELEAALDAERQALRDQIQFIDMISHEYRTPVAVMRSSLDLLSISDAGAIPSVAQRIARMRRATDRLVEIIEVGLSRDKVDPNRLQMRSRPTDLAELVGDAVQAVAAAHPARRIEAETVPAVIMGDPALLKTAIINLLDNACKYSPAEAPVEVALQATDGHAEIRVVDRGGGVDQGEAVRLFDKFYRGTGHSGVPGTGLGLHLVKRIVEMHCGAVTVDSRPGRTVFRLALPLQPDAAQAAAIG
ncbi:MAG TPA: sensor histidine kinase [Alphaproteobacteria bacterium]|nr:sensor histidine kinase [Alphaproteobacteria bacterium]